MALGRAKSRTVEDDPLLLQLNGSRITHFGKRNGYMPGKKLAVGQHTSMSLRRTYWEPDDASQDRQSKKPNDGYKEYELKLRNFRGTHTTMK